MPMQAKEIKGRLKSINNTQKITKTMELVSAAKMRRAIAAATNSRTYSDLAWGIMKRLRDAGQAAVDQTVARFFAEAETGKVTLVIFTSNRGLCGALNSNVMKEAFAFIEQHGRDNVNVIGIGKKGVSTLNSYGIKATAAYEKDDSAKNDASVREVAAHVHNSFRDGEANAVYVLYTDFISPVVQKATLKQLFPLQPTETSADGNQANSKLDFPYTYEPTETGVLEYLLPRIAESELYRALLESNASEHSARMIAMKNASEAAGEMGNDLKLAFNRARQAGITQEIAEISAGSAAIS